VTSICEIMTPMNAPERLPPSAFVAEDWVPPEIGKIANHQTDLPRIARDPALVQAIEARLPQPPTVHDVYRHDSRTFARLAPESVHLGGHVATILDSKGISRAPESNGRAALLTDLHIRPVYRTIVLWVKRASHARIIKGLDQLPSTVIAVPRTRILLLHRK
jgi:hypothetical protein